MRVAVVHEWTSGYAGSEKVLEQILALYPDADLYCVADFLPETERRFLRGRAVRTSAIQRMPFGRSHYRAYSFLAPLAVEGFDLRQYDLIISSSHFVSKGVLTGPDQVHVCYCHTPMRYAWDLQHEYLQNAGLTGGLKRILARALLHYLRLWDLRTVNGVDAFVANSQYVSRRIRRIYGRAATVIHPPVPVDDFPLYSGSRDDYYVVVSRLVPYKRIELLIEAFSHCPRRRLLVVGSGPGMKRCAAMSTPNVTLLGHQPQTEVVRLLQHARAFVFAAEEDFGICLVEAQACGTPVICYEAGGAGDIVIPGVTGHFFRRQDVPAVLEALDRFERAAATFEPRAIRRQAERFDVARFRDAFGALVETTMARRSGSAGTTAIDALEFSRAD